MSALLGFADAVRAAGDGWLDYGMCAAWRAGDRRLGDAFLMADGRVRAEMREQQVYRNLVRLADVQAQRARREVFAGVAS